MTTTETPTVAAPAPKKRKIVRRGPPGVRCPDCGKLAGAQDEGEVEGYSVESSGDIESVEVTIDATLYLSTACCGSQYKSYDLSGNSKTQDHSCTKVADRDAAKAAWDEHLEPDGEGVPNCERRRAGDDGCREDGSDPACDIGVGLKATLDELQQAVDNDGEDWSVEEEGEPEPYERAQTTFYDKRTKTQKPIKSFRYAKRFRGINVTVSVEHALCGETEEVVFGEGDIEAGAGDFEATN